MKFRTKQLTALMDKPSPTGTNLFTLATGTVLTFAGEKSQDGQWVKVDPPDGAPSAGWLFTAHAEEIPDVRPEIDAAGFISTAILAERIFNTRDSVAPFFVTADFVIARALFENKLVNLPAQISGPDGVGPLELANLPAQIPGSDGVGPLQMSSAEWADFLANAGSFAEDFDTAERGEPSIQVYAATYRMHADAKKVSQAKLAGGVGSQDEPPLPSYLEVFLAYLTNNAKAAAALADASSTAADKGKADAGAAGAQGASPNAAKPLKDFLTGLMTEAEVTAFFTARGKLTGPIANSNKVGDFVSNTETILNAALRAAFDKIKQFFPDELPVVTAGNAPWFAVARAEEKRGVKEPDPRILDYFKSINFPTDTTKTPWCAAFVSFCMKNSGDPRAAASVPTQAPARAATWRSWGNALPLNSSDVPTGAVVVLSPTEKNDSSGHVAFFVKGDANSVTLLGGNQSDQVKESTFARSRVVAIEWLDAAPDSSHTAENLGATSGTFKQVAPTVMKRLIADFEFTKEQAAGILGNLGEESGGFKEIQEIKPIGGGKGGLGWAQWTGSRRTLFEKFLQQQGLQANSFEGNYGFLKQELSTKPEFHSAVTAVKATGTVQAAVRAFEATFEKANPNFVHFEVRDQFAQIALTAFNALGGA